MNNKIILVTGATRGIGKAVIHNLLKTTDSIIIGTGTTEDGVKNIGEYLGNRGIGMLLDITSQENIASVIKDIEAKYGVIDTLINNAGVTKDKLLLRMNIDDWQSVIDTNLTSVFLLTKAVIRGMIKNKFGKIVSISSIVGFTGNAGQSNYAASKAGIVAMTKSFAQEFGSRNININCVAPGFIATDMTDKLDDAVKTEYMKNISLKRFGHADDIANAVRFLIGNESSYITGTTIHVNGGMNAL